MNYWRYWQAQIRTQQMMPDIEKAWKAGKQTSMALAVFKAAGLLPQETAEVDHPLRAGRMKKIQREIPKAVPADFNTICLGDSIFDIPRSRFLSIKEVANLSQSGAHHYHLGHQIADAYPLLPNRAVQNIVMGTGIGNPLIVGQDYDYSFQKLRKQWDGVRALYPGRRMIIVGLPPTYSVWANLHRPKFELDAFGWVRQDENAVFVSFRRFGGVLPKIAMSSDTTHLTRAGEVKLDGLIEKAKTLPRGSTVG